MIDNNSEIDYVKIVGILFDVLKEPTFKVAKYLRKLDSALLKKIVNYECAILRNAPLQYAVVHAKVSRFLSYRAHMPINTISIVFHNIITCVFFYSA